MIETAKKSFQRSLFIVLVFYFLSMPVLPVLSQESSGGSLEIFKESHHLLPDFDDSYGVVFDDISGDMRPDIYVVRFRNLNRLFIQSSDSLAFEDHTIRAGLGGNLMPRGLQNLELGASSTDINNDGLKDMIIAGWGETTHLFLQQKDGRFQDITDMAGFIPPIDGNGAFWADINIDGHLDLFITDEHHVNHLYLGDGRGRFRNVSQSWGITDKQVSQGAAFADMDRDGYPDLYVCNWFAPDKFYRNERGTGFTAVSLNIPHLQQPFNSNGVSFADMDNDGDLDLIVTDRDGKSALYLNLTDSTNKKWQFRDVTAEAGLVIPDAAYGSVLADFNNDGRMDVWISTIGPNFLFLQKEQLQFEKVFEKQVPPHSNIQYYSTGAACADVDNDGDLDLFVSNKDTNSVIYLNQTNNNHSLKLTIRGIRSNRDAIGSKIRLYIQGPENQKLRLAGYREISGGSGYLSQNSSTVQFGVKPRQLYQVTVEFPGGINKNLDHLMAGGHYTIVEETGILSLFFRASSYLYRVTGSANFTEILLLYILLIASVLSYILFSTYRYHWASRQIIIFFGLALVLLYGIFMVFQGSSLQTRLVYQLLSLFLLIGILTVFMEKIRKMELSRRQSRNLLRDFTRQLVLIKNNDELFRKIFDTILSSLQPEVCVIYQTEGPSLRRLHSTGKPEVPETFALNDEEFEFLISRGFVKSLKDSRPDLHQWSIARDNQLYGLLLLKPSQIYQKLSQEDFLMFDSLTTQMAIAIQNNFYIEESKELVRRITATETREKYLEELEKANEKLKSNNQKLKKLFKDLKETQTQLVQSEKMAGLGQLVAGIAHELNNPISYIYANMKELENYINAFTELIIAVTENPDSPEQFRESLKQLQSRYDLGFIREDIASIISENIEGSQRVKHVVQNLRDFSRLDESDIKPVDLHQGLESTLLLLNNEIKNRITIHRNYGELPRVYCRPGNINQVFMNILLNAVQAIEGPGNIWINTAQVNSKVEITIRDDGPGIPPAIRSKLFDPFFTTKPVGEGTGLGLSISYNIIKEHGGKLSFTSNEGDGTTFKIELPVKQESKKLHR